MIDDARPLRLIVLKTLLMTEHCRGALRELRF